MIDGGGPIALLIMVILSNIALAGSCRGASMSAGQEESTGKAFDSIPGRRWFRPDVSDGVRGQRPKSGRRLARKRRDERWRPDSLLSRRECVFDNCWWYLQTKRFLSALVLVQGRGRTSFVGSNGSLSTCPRRDELHHWVDERFRVGFIRWLGSVS